MGMPVLEPDNKFTETQELTKKYVTKLSQMRTSLASLKPRIQAIKTTPTNTGISLLQVRNQFLFNLILSSCLIMYHKLDGKKIPRDVLMSAIESRLFLEKTLALRTKLNTQITALTNTTTTSLDESEVVEDTSNIDAGSIGVLQFKPTQSEFVGGGDLETQNDENEVYVPPKIAPVHFNVSREKNSGGLTRLQREVASKSRLLSDLNDVFRDGPEEVGVDGRNDRVGSGVGNSGGGAVEDEWNERIEFEEHNMMRKNFTRKDKAMIKQMNTTQNSMKFSNEFADIHTDFNSLSSALHTTTNSKPTFQSITQGRGVVGNLAKESGKRRSSGKDGFAKDKSQVKRARKQKQNE